MPDFEPYQILLTFIVSLVGLLILGIKIGSKWTNSRRDAMDTEAILKKLSDGSERHDARTKEIKETIRSEIGELKIRMTAHEKEGNVVTQLVARHDADIENIKENIARLES